MTDQFDEKAREIVWRTAPYNMSKEHVAYLNITKDIATALRSALSTARAAAFREAAEVARKHGEFCHNEAHHGGSHDLYERAKGAAYIASAITAKAEEADNG